jgi:hypothetical protein
MAIHQLKLVRESNVIPLHKRRAEDTIRALEQLLDHARAGYIKGVAWSAMYDGKRHDVGATGEYVHKLEHAVGGLASLLNALHLHDPT